MRRKKNYYFIEEFIERMKGNGRHSMMRFLHSLPISVVLRVIYSKIEIMHRVTLRFYLDVILNI